MNTNQPNHETFSFEHYRDTYFLDPNGSNTKNFLELSNRMLTHLLKTYTNEDYSVNIIENHSTVGKCEVRIRGNRTEKETKIAVLGADFNENVIAFPEHGLPPEEVIDTLCDELEDEIRFNHRFMGQMHPHDNILSFVGGLAGKFMNGNTIAKEVSPITTLYEIQVVNYLADKFGFNPDLSWLSTIVTDEKFNENLKAFVLSHSNCDSRVNPLSSGNITSGGTTANLSAYLVCKKVAKEDMKGKRMSDDEIERSLANSVVICSEYAHYSHAKLCGFVGVKEYKRVKTNKNHRIDASFVGAGSLTDCLWAAGDAGKRVIAVVATAGTTETGDIDDIEGIADLLDKFEAEFNYRPFFHVDAAHGGGFILHPDFNKDTGKLKGIQRADSITIDPHKMLYINYCAGAIIFKDRNNHKLLKQEASYLFKNNGDHNFGAFRVEGSMGLEGAMQTWASIKGLGREGYYLIQEHALAMTRYLKQALEKEGIFEVMNDPQMNLLCFRFAPSNSNLDPVEIDTINRKAQEEMFERGLAYISNDSLFHRENEQSVGRNVDVFRAVLMHPFTDKQDVDFAVAEVKSCIRDVLRELATNATNVRDYQITFP